jgi:hypothetical protein
VVSYCYVEGEFRTSLQKQVSMTLSLPEYYDSWNLACST